jgi:hypothetical protein
MARHVGRHAPLLVSDKAGADECIGIGAIDSRAGRAARAAPVAARDKQDAAGYITAGEALHDLAGTG